MARKKKTISLEEIPLVQQKIISLIDSQVNSLSKKDDLTSDDCRNLIAFASTLQSIYKDHRAEVLEIKKELKSKSKDEILQIINAEGSN